MLEEAIVEGYKHMWLELTVLKPDGSETVLSMDPTAAQFGSPQPIVTWQQPRARQALSSSLQRKH
jgi:hypothetical protein